MFSLILWWFAVSVALGILAGKCMYAMGGGQDAPRRVAHDDGQGRRIVRPLATG